MAENLNNVGAPIQDQEEVKVQSGRARSIAASDLPDKVHTWPYLVRAEFIAGCVLLLVLLVWSITVDAPMEEPANPTKTPNPSKAPWYFLGLQEMLVYFDPWIAGVVLPPHHRRPDGDPLRRHPWDFWDPHKVVPLTNIDLPYFIGIRSQMLALLFGAICVGGWLVGVPGAIWQKFKDRPILRELGFVRYGIVATLFMIMSGVVVKMALRLLFNIKYILVIPNILNV
jgi:hypothetical protein